RLPTRSPPVGPRRRPAALGRGAGPPRRPTRRRPPGPGRRVRPPGRRHLLPGAVAPAADPAASPVHRRRPARTYGPTPVAPYATTGPRRARTAPKEGGHPLTTRMAVFGAGSWGTAFAMILADAGCRVTLW